MAQLAEWMRSEDAAEAEALGVRPRRALWRSYRTGIMRRTAFVDGEIAAMWGVSGNFLGGIGAPWLVTTKAAERVPVTYIKIGRRQVGEMLSLFPVLENYVPLAYRRAVNMIELLGFTVDPPAPFGPKHELFCRFRMVR